MKNNVVQRIGEINTYVFHLWNMYIELVDPMRRGKTCISLGISKFDHIRNALFNIVWNSLYDNVTCIFVAVMINPDIETKR